VSNNIVFFFSFQTLSTPSKPPLKRDQGSFKTKKRKEKKPLIRYLPWTKQNVQTNKIGLILPAPLNMTKSITTHHPFLRSEKEKIKRVIRRERGKKECERPR